MNEADEIRIEGIRLECIIGFSQHETDILQPVDVDLVLFLDPPDQGYTDDPAEVVDYKRLKDKIRTSVFGQRFMVLEALAERVAAICLQPPVHSVRLTAHKPGALTGARDVAVRITRHAAVRPREASARPLAAGRHTAS